MTFSVALAWGVSGHHVVTFHATGLLPEELRGFFRANTESLLAFSAEPDLLAERDPTEGPNHYFDLDAFDKPPFDNIPTAEAAFKKRFGADAAGKGRLPWAIEDHYNSLVDAFRDKDLQAILKHAGFLSHYVADATMPLHATVNYKGQFSGNVIFDVDRQSPASIHRHVHVRFEIGMIDANRSDIELKTAELLSNPRRVDDPAAAALELAKDSYAHIDTILIADRALLQPGARISDADPGYYEKLYAQTSDLAAARLAAAATAVASLWQSAWEDAGRPKFLAAKVILRSPTLATPGENAPDYKNLRAQPQ